MEKSGISNGEEIKRMEKGLRDRVERSPMEKQDLMEKRNKAYDPS